MIEIWSKTFCLSANHVKIGAVETLVTEYRLKREEKFVKASKVFQTPKRKKFSEVAPSLEPTKRYKHMLKEKEFDSSEIEALVRYFDESIDDLSSQVHSFQLVQKFLTNVLKDSTSSVDVKLSKINDTIGRNPVPLDNSFDAPDLWGAISEIGSELKEHADTTASNHIYKCVQLEKKIPKVNQCGLC